MKNELFKSTIIHKQRISQYLQKMADSIGASQQFKKIKAQSFKIHSEQLERAHLPKPYKLKTQQNYTNILIQQLPNNQQIFSLKINQFMTLKLDKLKQIKKDEKNIIQQIASREQKINSIYCDQVQLSNQTEYISQEFNRILQLSKIYLLQQCIKLGKQIQGYRYKKFKQVPKKLFFLMIKIPYQYEKIRQNLIKKLYRTKKSEFKESQINKLKSMIWIFQNYKNYNLKHSFYKLNSFKNIFTFYQKEDQNTYKTLRAQQVRNRNIKRKAFYSIVRQASRIKQSNQRWKQAYAKSKCLLPLSSTTFSPTFQKQQLTFLPQQQNRYQSSLNSFKKTLKEYKLDPIILFEGELFKEENKQKHETQMYDKDIMLSKCFKGWKNILKKKKKEILEYEKRLIRIKSLKVKKLFFKNFKINNNMHKQIYNKFLKTKILKAKHLLAKVFNYFKNLIKNKKVKKFKLTTYQDYHKLQIFQKIFKALKNYRQTKLRYKFMEYKYQNMYNKKLIRKVFKDLSTMVRNNKIEKQIYKLYNPNQRSQQKKIFINAEELKYGQKKQKQNFEIRREQMAFKYSQLKKLKKMFMAWKKLAQKVKVLQKIQQKMLEFYNKKNTQKYLTKWFMKYMSSLREKYMQQNPKILQNNNHSQWLQRLNKNVQFYNQLFKG